MRLFYGLLLSSVIMLSACASYIDTPNQQVQVLTPGAVGARCTLTTDYAKHVVSPPETIFIRRMQEPLKVTCQAPGNREKTIYAYSKLNKSAAANVATAGVGAVYDQASGALYEYPHVISVDFRNTTARGAGLPTYHSADTVSPFNQAPEDMQDAPAQRPTDPGVRGPAPEGNTEIKMQDAQSPY